MDEVAAREEVEGTAAFVEIFPAEHTCGWSVVEPLPLHAVGCAKGQVLAIAKVVASGCCRIQDGLVLPVLGKKGKLLGRKLEGDANGKKAYQISR